MHQDTICDLCLRLSLDRDGKTAIERQESDCRAWAESSGLTVRKVHIDRGRSGYKTVERKGFDAALAAVTAGVVGALIVWKLDRLSRRGIGEVGKVLDGIGKAGGRLVSVLDGLDTSNDSARKVVAMLAELARSESTYLGTRVGHAKRHLRSDRRDRLSLAIDRVEVSKRVRGQRIIPEQRIHIHWAKPATVDTAV